MCAWNSHLNSLHKGAEAVESTSVAFFLFYIVWRQLSVSCRIWSSMKACVGHTGSISKTISLSPSNNSAMGHGSTLMGAPNFLSARQCKKKNHNYVVGLEAGLHGHKMSTKIQHENLQSRLSSLYLLNVFDQTMRIILFKSTDARTRHLFVSLRADQHLKHKKSRSYKEIEAPLSFWLGRPKK
jgi:hypothetical protein